MQQYCNNDSRTLTTQSFAHNQPRTILISTIENTTIPRINNTLTPKQEIEMINNALDIGELDIQIIIYGKNGNDETIASKYKQLNGLGFNNVKLYLGGITEWLLLQEIFGVETYPICRENESQPTNQYRASDPYIMSDHERMNCIIQLLD